MGGKGGGQVVGYWYHPVFQVCLHNGPMDALIQIQGGPYTAWSGNLTATGTVTINQPNLWGGEKAEGGIVGGIDIFFGDADQPAITYSTPGGDVKFELLELIEGRLYGDSEALNRITSTDGSAHRGKVIAIFKGGRYGANNPYPKPISFLSTRILKGWDDDDCWYPEKAVIPLSGVAGVDFIIDDTALPCPNASSGTQTYTFSGVTPSDVIVFYKAAGGAYGGWSAWGTDDPALEHPTPPVPGSVWFNTFTVTGVVVDSVGAGGPWSYTSPYYSSEADAAAGAIAAGELLRVTGYSEYNITIADSNPADDRGGLSVSVGITAADINAMNPAHIIYESLTAFDMGAEPTANINDASFRAAADQLYSEGFGLCTLYDPAAETIEQFRARICNTAGVSITRSPIDGLWYLDMLRGGGDPSLLPVLTDDDILDYVEDRVSLDDVVNQVAVQWFDPIMKQQRTTAPVQAIGAIDSFQVINAQTTEYLEIPTEPLALRAAARDLGTLSLPLTRLTFTTNRKPYGWRSGTYFVLDAPKRGIASEVFLIGDINRGTLKSGAIQMKAIQDNYSLPLTTFVSSEIGNVQSLQPARPVPVTLQVAMEVPYAFLVSSLTASQLSGLDPDSGYLGVIGVRPIAGSAGFDLETGVGGAYSDVGNGQWCPSTTIPASAGIGDTALIIAGNTDLTFVQTGAAALWDAEIVRIDAIDLIGGTCTVGRGCADTISQIHGATSRIYFCGGTLASDKVEYMSGEVVNAKLLTRTNAGILPDSAATPVSVTMAGRQALPYPPAMIKINGVRWDQVTTLSGTFTVTWAERNRLSQADQLVDQTAATITPETNTRYFLAFYDATNTLLVSRNDIGGTTASVVLNSSGAVTMKMHAINDNGASFQEYAIPLAYSPGPGGGLASAIIAGSDPAQGLFVIVVVGSGPSYTYYDSPDALTWTARITNDVSLDFPHDQLVGFKKVGSNWYANKNGSAAFWKSNNATWYTLPWSQTTGSGPNPNKVRYLNGGWVLWAATNFYTSTDFTTWTASVLPSGLPAHFVYSDLLWDSTNSRYLLFGNVKNPGTAYSAHLYKSTDLVNWTEIGGFNALLSANSVLADEFQADIVVGQDGSGNIVAAGITGATLTVIGTNDELNPWTPFIAKSADNGSTWSLASASFPTALTTTYNVPVPNQLDSPLDGVLWDGSNFFCYAKGYFGRSADHGVTWTWVTAPANHHYMCCANGSGTVLFQGHGPLGADAIGVNQASGTSGGGLSGGANSITATAYTPVFNGTIVDGGHA